MNWLNIKFSFQSPHVPRKIFLWLSQTYKDHLWATHTNTFSNVTILPSNQSNGTWSKLIHQDTKREGGGTKQEGTDGEAQIQHLFLVHTADPLLNLLARGVTQRHVRCVIFCGNKCVGLMRDRSRTIWVFQVFCGLWLDSKTKHYFPHFLNLS